MTPFHKAQGRSQGRKCAWNGIARKAQSVCRVSILAVSRGSITNQNNPMQGPPIVADPNLVKLGEINTSAIFGDSNVLQRVPQLNSRDSWELQTRLGTVQKTVNCHVCNRLHFTVSFRIPVIAYGCTYLTPYTVLGQRPYDVMSLQLVASKSLIGVLTGNTHRSYSRVSSYVIKNTRLRSIRIMSVLGYAYAGYCLRG